jgi:transcriptional regulator with XRE-family HTH domain
LLTKGPQTPLSPSPIVPSIKFAETLRYLIEESPFKHNRKPIWESLHITSAALSQYVQGQSRPRFETLVGLADFFGVSIDYLMRGESPHRGASEQSITRYVDWALADIQSRTGAKAWLTARIGDSLAERIQDVADNAIAEMSALSGILTDDDLLLLESVSVEVRLMVTYLDYDLLDVDDASPATGRFTEVVANNLRTRPARKYCFLLPPTDPVLWQGRVHALRQVLQRDFGVTKAQLARCQFRAANTAFMCGSGFYQLDLASAQRRSPSLLQLLEPYLVDKWMGYVMHPNSETKGDVLYDAEHLERAMSVWNNLWHTATDVR